jgi:hypothetical protein
MDTIGGVEDLVGDLILGHIEMVGLAVTFTFNHLDALWGWLDSQ